MNQTPLSNDEMKKELRKLAHDLRNSLSSIYSCAQLLEMLLEKAPASTKNTVQLIVESAQKMERQIAERLDPLKE
jgi:nitrogen-specific signal transduction histidine kinase